jgi:hypothetical protein
VSFKLLRSELRTDRNFSADYDFLLVNGKTNVFFQRGDLYAVRQLVADCWIHIEPLTLIFCRDVSCEKIISKLAEELGIRTKIHGG